MILLNKLLRQLLQRSHMTGNKRNMLNLFCQKTYGSSTDRAGGTDYNSTAFLQVLTHHSGSLLGSLNSGSNGIAVAAGNCYIQIFRYGNACITDNRSESSQADNLGSQLLSNLAGLDNSVHNKFLRQLHHLLSSQRTADKPAFGFGIRTLDAGNMRNLERLLHFQTGFDYRVGNIPHQW